MSRHFAAVVVTAAAVLSPASASAATIWSPLTSSTTHAITAISYQGDDKLYFTTASGEIFKEATDGTSAALQFSVGGIVLNDIAFAPGSTIGYAVGAAGHIYHTTNGTSWSQVSTAGLNTGTDCGNSTPTALSAFDLGSVTFKDSTTVYISGVGTSAKGIVQKSTNANLASPTFTEVGRVSNTCRTGTADLTDIHVLPGTDSLYLADQDFGHVWFSANGLTTAASQRSSSVNCFTGNPRMAIDDTNPNVVVVVDRCPGNLSYEFSTDGGQNYAAPSFPNFTDTPPGAYDVATSGGMTFAVGNSGSIFQSPDGRTAYYQPAGGSVATTDWKAVGMNSASTAVVGGVGGALIRSTTANQIPDIVAPAGTVTGPTTVVAGQAATYTANVSDNAGGSGIDTSSFQWTAPGVPNATGNPVSLTFPSAGIYNVHVAFKDLAGNAGEASLSVNVTAPGTGGGGGGGGSIPPGTVNPTPTKTVTLDGSKITLGVPKTCVAKGKSFKAKLAFHRYRKGFKPLKVSKVIFYVDGKKRVTDRKKPFVQVLKVSGAGKHTLKAKATIKKPHHKTKTKTISTKFLVCSS